MKILLGIIFFYTLAIIRAKWSDGKQTPYLTIIFISLALVVFVIIMMFLMPEPDPIL
jgi:hypothetical protein